MNIIVQKYGGTSLTNEEKRLYVVSHIKKAINDGYKVVVVVSAMGRKGDPYATDTLLQLVDGENTKIRPREKDLLLICGEIISATVLSNLLHKNNLDNIVLTGGQAGFLTDGNYNNAQILNVNPSLIIDNLQKNKIVIVTGFQGETGDKNFTTLGRGGSDTTATALGVALNAEIVDIFTDVEGIMTADPKIVNDAKQLDIVTYTEVANFAHQGAKVIHPRAVEIAMQGNIPVRVRSTFSDHEGTLVTSYDKVKKSLNRIIDKVITGITSSSNISQIKVQIKQDKFNTQMQVFGLMAINGISVDFINVSPTLISFTISTENIDRAINILNNNGYDIELTKKCAKISLIGAGMAGVPGIMANIIEVLTNEKIEILQTADSHTTIWVLVTEENVEKAIKALHSKFNLNYY